MACQPRAERDALTTDASCIEAEAPTLSLGEARAIITDDGTAEYAFTKSSARRHSNSDVLVADQGTRQIRRYDRQGRLRAVLARSGNGPGELSGDFTMAVHGDSLFVFANSLVMSGAWLGVYDVDSGFVRQHIGLRPPKAYARAPGTPTRFVIRDRLVTGELLVEAGGGWRILREAPRLGVLTADSVRLGLMRHSTNTPDMQIDWFEPSLRGWSFAYPWPGGPIPTSTRAYPFALGQLFVVSGEIVWLGDARTGKLRALDGSGEERASAAVHFHAASFVEQELARVQESLLQSDRSEIGRARITAMFDRALLPDTAPRFASLSAGHAGEVWVQCFDVDPDAAARYVIVSANGAVVGTARLPPRIAIQHVGHDFVLGVRRDSLNVESIVEFPLARR